MRLVLIYNRLVGTCRGTIAEGGGGGRRLGLPPAWSRTATAATRLLRARILLAMEVFQLAYSVEQRSYVATLLHVFKLYELVSYVLGHTRKEEPKPLVWGHFAAEILL